MNSKFLNDCSAFKFYFSVTLLFCLIIQFFFQSRPVTSGTEETDFEIEHELDAALRIENDYLSVSNVA